MNKTEQLAHWYLRLNGFLTIPNFILHPNHPDSQRTDADVIGLRFPHRVELRSASIDDTPFASLDRPYLVLAEVKTTYVKLNKAWIEAKRQNINDILKAIGLFPSQGIDAVAAALYSSGVYDGDIRCSLLFIGDQIDPILLPRFSAVPHLTWNQVLLFIHNRFTAFGPIKRQNDQWDDTGLALWELVQHHHQKSDFVIAARRAFNLRNDLDLTLGQTVS